jgi:hypothetical protein
VDLRGKQIVKIGIVVEDVEKTAARYSELFGVGPWAVHEFSWTNTILHGKPLGSAEVVVKGALADLTGLELELLQPVAGPSSHREFSERHGQGVHHISFGHVDDADELLAAFRKAGYEIEMSGVRDGAETVYYMATQEDLGTIIGFSDRHAEKKSAPKPSSISELEGPSLIDTKEKKLFQFGFASADVDRMARRYYEMFGTPFYFVDFTPSHLSKVILHDEPMT